MYCFKMKTSFALYSMSMKGNCFHSFTRPLFRNNYSLTSDNTKQKLILNIPVRSKSFGFFFDIDGVFTIGKNPLPEAKEAFSLLLDKRGKWRVPSVFVTNAGNTLKKVKAEKLSEMFKAHVLPEQVVMSHSPLSMFTQFHNRHVLVCGQGPVKEIAKNLGFRDVVSMDELRNHFPQLDVCDHNRRKAAPCAFEKYNKNIEAIVLFGEPVKWETSLQLLLDILMTAGQPYADRDKSALIHSVQDMIITEDGEEVIENTGPVKHYSVPYPHIPVLACNMDLLWMAEAPLPRLAHGSFLLCLESLYEKLSGRRLLYTALVGKPSEITYHHAEYRLHQMAHGVCRLNSPVSTIYCVGDNPHTDIYGANLYNQYLASKRSAAKSTVSLYAKSASVSAVGSASLKNAAEIRTTRDGNSTPIAWGTGAASSCRSILVLTGVFRQNNTELPDEIKMTEILAAESSENINHNHRDFPDYPELKVPSYVANNIYDAIYDVYKNEGFSI